MKYHLVTLGCPKNVTDSVQLTRALRAAGHAPVESPQPADLLIVNSCGFIDAAKAESEQTARQFGIEKRTEQRLIVVGCWSQIEPDRAVAIAGVDRAFGIVSALQFSSQAQIFTSHNRVWCEVRQLNAPIHGHLKAAIHFSQFCA